LHDLSGQDARDFVRRIWTPHSHAGLTHSKNPFTVLPWHKLSTVLLVAFAPPQLRNALRLPALSDVLSGAQEEL
jgi:hypothetical protein